jgi:lipoate-protein ligase A
MIYLSTETDPHFNLAIEEWLFRGRRRDEAHLYLYRNRDSVVIGRNQNPWLETCLASRNGDGAPQLARRISGGGAVWHDLGNANFAFIVPRPLYDPDRFLRIAAAALADLGIGVEISARHNLLYRKRKVSGTAFMLASGSAMLHSTLLINADLDAMHRNLAPPAWRIEGKAIHSVPSPVVNLQTVQADLSFDRFVTALASRFAAAGFDSQGVTVEHLSRNDPKLQDDKRLRECLEKHISWEWVFGHTPGFTCTVDWQSNGMAQQFSVAAAKGLITSVEWLPGPADNGMLTQLSARLKGKPYDPDAVAAAIAAAAPTSGVAAEQIGQLHRAWLAGSIRQAGTESGSCAS